jgi:hypothetical protein
MIVFWVVVQRSLVESDRHFRGAYRLHHQGIKKIQCDAVSTLLRLSVSKTTLHSNPEGSHFRKYSQ